MLNLARVLIYPEWQRGGQFCNPKDVPGFYDRKGEWHSKLASELLLAAVNGIGFAYLTHRPPCFLEEPYEIRWLLSYCDTSLHKGTIYRAAGWELYSTNARGIQTWRVRVPGLNSWEDKDIRAIAATHPRSVRYRNQRAQLGLGL